MSGRPKTPNKLLKILTWCSSSQVYLGNLHALGWDSMPTASDLILRKVKIHLNSTCIFKVLKPYRRMSQSPTWNRPYSLYVSDSTWCWYVSWRPSRGNAHLIHCTMLTHILGCAFGIACCLIYSHELRPLLHSPAF